MFIFSIIMISNATRIIVPEAEKTESLTELIAEEMEILVPQSSTIADDMEMIVKETQLIGTTVLSKGKTGMEAAAGVSDGKQSACLVCRLPSHAGLSSMRRSISNPIGSLEFSTA